MAASSKGSSNDRVCRGIPLVSASNVTAYDVEDTEIFEFKLTDSEMATLSAL